MTLWPGAIYPSSQRLWADKAWNVLAAGPSVWETPRFALLPAPTVAINRAINLAGRLPIDVWACWDHPDRLGIPSRDLAKTIGGLEVWANPAHLEIYQKLGATWLKPLPLGVLWNEVRQDLTFAPCLWMVLDHLEHLGCRHFRCFGVDNQGTFRFNQAGSRWKREATPEEERRWLHERKIWEEAAIKASRAGMILERWPQDLAA